MLSVVFSAFMGYLKKVVDLSDSSCFGLVDFFNHLPGDGLKTGQCEQNGSESTSTVVLTVTYVVLQVYLKICSKI